MHFLTNFMYGNGQYDGAECTCAKKLGIPNRLHPQNAEAQKRSKVGQFVIIGLSRWEEARVTLTLRLRALLAPWQRCPAPFAPGGPRAELAS